MQFRKSSNVDSHHTNPNYVCLIIEFLKTDSNVRLRYGRDDVLLDWLPTDAEARKFVEEMLKISPTFREWITKRFGTKSYF